MKRSLLLLCLLLSTSAYADVILKIVATNPLDRKQIAKINSCLPEEVRPSDIIDTDGLSIVYDIQNETYGVAGSVVLNPKEERTLSVTLKDVWTVPVGHELRSLTAHAESLISRVAGGEWQVARGKRKTGVHNRGSVPNVLRLWGRYGIKLAIQVEMLWYDVGIHE